MSTNIFISAGEVSGDMHAANLVTSIKNLRPDLQFWGMGGSNLRKVQVDTIVDSEKEASVMGFVEVFAKLPNLIKNFRLLCQTAKQKKPDLAILVDFPDFNLRLAKELHALNIPVMYYISPQVWAWRTGRIKDIKKYVSCMVPILPFEEQFYRNHGIDAKYLGHPLLDQDKDLKFFNRNEFLTSHNINPELPVLSLLPGSRTKEITRILPTMISATKLLKESIPQLQTLLPIASSLSFDFIKSFIQDLPVTLVQQQSKEALKAADVTLVTSGTACLEAALIGNPFLVVYKANSFSYTLARWFVGNRIKWIALPNLITQQKIVEELLQDDCSPERIAKELLPFFTDKTSVEAFKSKIQLVRSTLSIDNSISSSQRIANAALEMINKTSK